ncbi:hypothetical protein CKM354_001206600 [Cercospora kikuchii]|uniref:Uncharacterized protein n=1 Tax=Cercospora kikuchii TaxID=84275 RepID=A0A9P3CY03_9PEZI|nr:uncharacterized protein CKM354_001206600 [Cercospora kikuchii]GIZ49025.1 hypothetical protein CKM354_001206600 [Cercospora kikuchii]
MTGLPYSRRTSVAAPGVSSDNLMSLPSVAQDRSRRLERQRRQEPESSSLPRNFDSAALDDETYRHSLMPTPETEAPSEVITRGDILKDARTINALPRPALRRPTSRARKDAALMPPPPRPVGTVVLQRRHHANPQNPLPPHPQRQISGLQQSVSARSTPQPQHSTSLSSRSARSPQPRRMPLLPLSNNTDNSTSGLFGPGHAATSTPAVPQKRNALALDARLPKRPQLPDQFVRSSSAETFQGHIASDPFLLQPSDNGGRPTSPAHAADSSFATFHDRGEAEFLAVVGDIHTEDISSGDTVQTSPKRRPASSRTRPLTPSARSHSVTHGHIRSSGAAYLDEQEAQPRHSIVPERQTDADVFNGNAPTSEVYIFTPPDFAEPTSCDAIMTGGNNTPRHARSQRDSMPAPVLPELKRQGTANARQILRNIGNIPTSDIQALAQRPNEDFDAFVNGWIESTPSRRPVSPSPSHGHDPLERSLTFNTDSLPDARTYYHEDQGEDDDTPVACNMNPFSVSDQVLESIDRATQGIDADKALAHEETQMLNPLRASTRQALAEHYRRERQKGKLEFVKFIYEVEINCTTLRGWDQERAIVAAYVTYLGFEDCIITGLIEGDLPTKYSNPASREYELEQKYRTRAEKAGHPGYYMNALQDEEGSAPSCETLRLVLRDFKAYVQGGYRNWDLIAQVDSQMGQKPPRQQTRSGYRKYFWTKDGDHEIERRVRACITFAKYLTRELDEFAATGSEEDVFWQFLVEFGFSTRLLGRRDEHETHENSNYIMNLFEACMRRQFGTRYLFRWYVVALCDAPAHAALGEIIVTRLGQGYVTSGTGLSHYPAGRSAPGRSLAKGG